MGIPESVLLLSLLTLSTVGTATSQAISESNRAKESKKARQSAERVAANRDIGNLSPGEASASASKRAFRSGLIFTSPTGTQGVGSRGRSRLMGTA